jgi:ankyrin repeat protein
MRNEESVMKKVFSFIPAMLLLFVMNAAGFDEQIAANHDLFSAVQSGFFEAVKDALSRGANPNAEDEDMFTPLYYAAMYGYTEIAAYLLDKGAYVDGWYDEYQFGFETPLHYAAENGHVQMVKLLLTYGARVDAQYLGQTPLHSAVHNGYLDIAQVLIDHGASIDACDEEGYTPLYLAVQSGYREIVSYLLEKAALVNINLAVNENSPLHAAIAQGDTVIVKLLLEHGADVAAKNTSGETPLMVAYALGNSDIILLLEQYTKPIPCIEVEKNTVWFINTGERYEVGLLATSDDIPFSLEQTYAFSPDSSYLAYVGETAHGYDIFLVSHDGDVQWITEQGTIDGRTSIAWSNSGSQFVFNMNKELWFYNVKYENLIKLTDPIVYEDMYPSFKDDDKKVKFFRGDRYKFAFAGKEYEVKIDGSNCREVAGGEHIQSE